MKVLTFFTVRGGSGKTVLSAAFASYVSYILGKRTMIYRRAVFLLYWSDMPKC